MRPGNGGLFAIAAAFFLHGSGVAYAAERAAEVVSVQGQGEARVDESAAWRPATAKQELPALSFVRTGAYSRMGLLFRDNTQVRLAEKTVMQIKAAPAGAGARTVVRLEQGRSWSQTNRTPSNLYFETPSATAAIRGTDWEIEVFEGGRSQLTVLSGEVEFFNDFGRVIVGRNEAAQAIPGQAPVKILIANPRDRVQWVTAYSIDPSRHIDSTAAGAEERARLQRIAAHVAAQRLEAAYASAVDEIGAGRATQPAAYLIAADLMVHQGRIDRANDFLQQGLARFRDDPRLIAQLARVSLAAGDFEGTRARLASSPAAADAFETRLAAADLARASGEARAARRGYVAARAQRPEDDRGWAGVGIVDAEREAIAPGRRNLEEAVKRRPDSWQGELGTLETLANRHEQAAAAFDAALAANPSDYVAMTGLGLLELKRGNPRAALDAFLRAATLEPRYARARMYGAVAHYQLGNREIALRELRSASEADDKDPLPHLFASMILSDLYRIDEAIAEAREATRLLPYLKSLNQVANDLQGSANLGRSLSLFGLEEWAQSRAQESYFPYWAGSHLFLADRYPGVFNKNSALLQGFIADPTVFGASNRFQTLVQSPGHYGRALFGYAYAEDIHAASPIGRLNGLVYLGAPVAYLVDVDAQRFRFTGSTRGPSDARNFTAAVGARPTHELGVFFYGFDGRSRDETFSPSIDYTQRLKTSTVNAGASYKFSPTSQLWLRAGRLRHSHENRGLFLDVEPFLSNLAHRQPEYGLRHTFDWRSHQVTWGAETAVKRTENLFASMPIPGVELHTTLLFNERSRNAYVSDAFDLTPRVRLQADAWWQDTPRRLERTSVGFFLGEPLADPDVVLEDRGMKKVTGRAGLRLKLSEGALVRAAWQDWIRPLGTSTLGPVATAGIPMDDRLVARGGRQERMRAQLEVEASARTYLTAFAERKEIENRRFGFAPFFITEDENLAKLRHFDYGQLGAEDLYDFLSPPEFDGARIDIAGVAWNQVLTRTLSLRLRYEHTRSRNTGEAFAGNEIALLPRHAASIAVTFVSPWRIYMTQRAVYRTRRYADEANLFARRPGWDAAADWFWESADKRWRVRYSMDFLLHKERETLYTLVLVASF